MNMQFIDSHTAGEPTRVIVAGGPELGDGPLAERVIRFREQFDHIRRAVILEPRGYDHLVGALLCPPHGPSCAAGVIFFNNAGYLGMCGHGAIGVAVTLLHLRDVGLGKFRLDTPVGAVEVDLHSPNIATIANVSSYRLHAGVEVDVPDWGKLRGDVAWGGNWFFLVDPPPIEVIPTNLAKLTQLASDIRQALYKQGVTGANGAEIDHIELSGPVGYLTAESRNFVLCPGGVYDRSPCGTGTSAKLACLAADGKLAPGVSWIQESIIGSNFAAHYELAGNGRITPYIMGSSHVTAKGELILHEDDPFRFGIDPQLLR